MGLCTLLFLFLFFFITPTVHDTRAHTSRQEARAHGTHARDGDEALVVPEAEEFLVGPGALLGEAEEQAGVAPREGEEGVVADGGLPDQGLKGVVARRRLLPQLLVCLQRSCVVHGDGSE